MSKTGRESPPCRGGKATHRVFVHRLLLVAKSPVLYRHEIANVAGVHINTVTNTLRRFKKHGVDGLLQADANAPDAELDAFNTLMRETWNREPPATRKQAAQQWAAITGIERSLSAVGRFLHRLGFARRKAGSVPAKADPAIQAAFAKNRMKRRLNAAERGEEDVYFMDASHFVFGAFLGYTEVRGVL